IDAGFDTAEVRNNLSFSLLRRGLNGDYAAAERMATEAIRINPGLRAAYYNRAWARLNLLPSRQANAETGLNDAREAINRGGGTAMLCYTAAALCAAELFDRGNPDDDPLNAAGLEFVRQAVANGYSKQKLSKSTRQYQRLADWAALLQPNEVAVRAPTGCDEH